MRLAGAVTLEFGALSPDKFWKGNGEHESFFGNFSARFLLSGAEE